MIPLMCLTLLCPFVEDEDVPILAFQERYLVALSRAKAVYQNLYIAETRAWFQNQAEINREFASGGCSGNHVMRRVESTKVGSAAEFLTRETHLLVTRPQPEARWILHDYYAVKTEKLYEDSKLNILRAFPEAYRLPFEIEMRGATIQDLLAGQAKTRRLQPSARYFVDRIVLMKRGDLGERYRLHFSLENQPREEFQGYVDMDPRRSFMVTAIKTSEDEWELEYGASIEGIPVLKKAIYKRLTRENKTNAASAVPLIEIRVEKAEKYTHVNEAEYRPEYYGLDARPTDPSAFAYEASPKIPIALWLSLFGVICFIAGILVLARAQRRARLAAKAAASAAALSGTIPSP